MKRRHFIADATAAALAASLPLPTLRSPELTLKGVPVVFDAPIDAGVDVTTYFVNPQGLQELRNGFCQTVTHPFSEEQQEISDG